MKDPEQLRIESAEIRFDPPLAQRTAKWRRVFMITERLGRIYEGIQARAKGGKVEVKIPRLLRLSNREEMGNPEVELTDLTVDTLQMRIRERLQSGRD